LLFRQAFLNGMRDGTITLAFRRWRRPTVRTGGTLLTAVGQIDIRSVTVVAFSAITERDARRAGYPSRAALVAELEQRSEGDIYRVELGPLRADPRIALRRAPATTDADLHKLQERLRRMDSRAAAGPWTRRTLQLIASRPGVRAGDLCAVLGQEKDEFKARVRRLKALGLTESLEVGYRLSLRGTSLLAAPSKGEA